MYRLLSAGTFGNTIEQFFDLDTWRPEADKYPLWGIRSAVVAGDPRCKLNIPVADVPALWFPGANISPMIDRHARLRVEMNRDVATWADRSGHPHPWRDAPWKHSTLSAARSILRAYCWPDDLDNIDRLLEEYPTATIEFSACDRAVGIVPCRNVVLWEVRDY